MAMDGRTATLGEPARQNLRAEGCFCAALLALAMFVGPVVAAGLPLWLRMPLGMGFILWTFRMIGLTLQGRLSRRLVARSLILELPLLILLVAASFGTFQWAARIESPWLAWVLAGLHLFLFPALLTFHDFAIQPWLLYVGSRDAALPLDASTLERFRDESRACLGRTITPRVVPHWEANAFATGILPWGRLVLVHDRLVRLLRPGELARSSRTSSDTCTATISGGRWGSRWRPGLSEPWVQWCCSGSGRVGVVDTRSRCGTPSSSP
jgi:Zn-dependent protease with chaperone function